MLNYRAPSRERMFLSDGWGIRDVQGAYMTRRTATLRVPAFLMLANNVHNFNMRFSVSNRSLLEAVYVKVTCEGIAAGTFIQKNSSAFVQISCPLLQDNHDTLILIENSVPATQSGYSAGLIDIVALDEISISRLQTNLGDSPK